MKYKYSKMSLTWSISDYELPIRLHKVDETQWEKLRDGMRRNGAKRLTAKIAPIG